jgi:hypothetical protein
MLAQCVSSLCAGEPKKVANYFTVENVKYPIFPTVFDGPLEGATTGAYLAKSIPSDLTADESNRPNDKGTPVIMGAELGT